jgi:hypothetical protein
MKQIQAGGGWAHRIYLFLLPIGVLFAAVFLRIWSLWVHSGFAANLEAHRAQASHSGDDLHWSAGLDATSEERECEAEGMSAALDRQAGLREKLVRATQTLNTLDDELVELECRLNGSSKELAQSVRDAIPALGRRLIALVQALDKKGLEPDNLLSFSDPAPVSRTVKSGRTKIRMDH